MDICLSDCSTILHMFYSAEVDEEAPVKNTLRMVEGAAEAFPSPEEPKQERNERCSGILNKTDPL